MVMPHPSVDFDAPDLAAQIERLTDGERDTLPFGVILLDREGVVRFYSATEKRAANYPGEVVGRNFFDVAPRSTKDELGALIMRAMEEGPVNLEFGWAGDHADPKRQFRLRVQSAKTGGVWLCFERDPAGAR
jgi:photoactive yellow protein